MMPTTSGLRLAFLITAALWVGSSAQAVAAEPEGQGALERQFAATVQPLLETYCHECHGNGKSEGKLDLSAYSSLAKVAAGHPTWATVLERLEAEEMPPEEAQAAADAEGAAGASSTGSGRCASTRRSGTRAIRASCPRGG